LRLHKPGATLLPLTLAFCVVAIVVMCWLDECEVAIVVNLRLSTETRPTQYATDITTHTDHRQTDRHTTRLCCWDLPSHSPGTAWATVLWLRAGFGSWDNNDFLTHTLDTTLT